MNDPKFDNDNINYGFLKKILKKYNLSDEINNSQTDSNTTISKIYILPPSPPYYKGTVLIYNQKIYKCIFERKIGTFNLNDWEVVATTDSELNQFIDNVYNVEKLQLQEQIDNKIQTYYQSNDPSTDWDVDLLKNKHVGDYWYNSENNTQWRYCKNTSVSPIEYSWQQVNVPNVIFDMINSKKSIYTSKPSSYKKNDLWIIETTIDDEDLPVSEENPIKIGDWVISTEDSEVYNKEHWIKKNNSVDIDYLNEHYYTVNEIDEKTEILEENYKSDILKSENDILLSVGSNYVKKDTYEQGINDFDKKVGTIETTVKEQKESLSNLRVDTNKITSDVSSITKIIYGNDIYILTEDTTFLDEKEYYSLNEDNQYILLVENTDYNIGDTISENVYEKENTDGLNDDVNNLKNDNKEMESLINNNYQEILDKFNGYTPQNKTVELEKNVIQLQTDTYTKTEINTKLTDGSVTKVQTISGTFDEEGMHYEKTGSRTSTTINEKGVNTQDTQSNEELLFAGFDEDLKESIVRTENLTARKYFVCGTNSRFEDYTDEDENEGTGVFIL